jgi:hypothetical protein|tara:strand:+ start:852 stop:1109 length:258 start_codon:yes stop_codon:yes gene_type:complete
MAKAKKITKDQLETVTKNQDQLTNMVNQIGVLETQKHSLLHQIGELNKTVEDFKSELEKEYGPVSIDLKTGVYTDIKDEGLKVAE